MKLSGWILTLLLAVQLPSFSEAVKTYRIEIPMNNPSTLNIINKNGSVRVSSWDKSFIEITATKISFAWKSDDELSKVQISLNETEDGLFTLSSQYQTDIDKVLVNLQIRIPQFVRLNTVETSKGDIIIRDIHGDLQISTTTGKIDLNNIKGSVNSRNSFGNQTLNNISGQIHVQSTNSWIYFFDSSADGEISAVNGRVELVSVRGKISASVGIGEIKAQDLSGDMDFEVQSGSIQLSNSRGPIRINAGIGSIEVTSSTGPLKARTETGKIEVFNTQLISGLETIMGKIEADIIRIPKDGALIETQVGSIRLSIRENINADFKIFNPRGKINLRMGRIKLTEDTETTLKGKFGNGGPMLTIRSRSGKISINPL